MNFHYYYLIQDIFGILLMFVNLRLILLCLKLLPKDKSTHMLMLIIHYACYFIAGSILLFSKFEVQTWIYSLIFLAVGRLLLVFNVKSGNALKES